MELKKIKKTTKQLELEVLGEDETILNPISEILIDHEEVEYASCIADHPTSDKRVLYIRLKKGTKSKPEEVLKKSIEKLEKQVDSFSKKIGKK